MTKRYDDNISILEKIKNDDSELRNNSFSIIAQIDELSKENIEMINYYKPFIFNMLKDKGTEKIVFIIIENEIKDVSIRKKIYNKFNKDEKIIIDIYITMIFIVCRYFPFTEGSVDSGEVIFNIDTRSIDVKYYNKNLIAKNVFDITLKKKIPMIENDIIIGEVYNNELHNVKIKEYDENTKIFKCCYMACEDMMDQELGNVSITKEKFMSDYKKGLRNVT